MKSIMNNMWGYWFTVLIIALIIAWVIFELFMKGANVIE